jgi:Ni/Co efflux regulator RcnB
MKKIFISILLAGSVLAAMPAWSSDRHEYKHQDKKQYSAHDNGHGKRHWKKHGSERRSYGHDYGRRHGYWSHNKRYYRPRHSYGYPGYSYYPDHYDDGDHWSIMFRYVD